MSSYDLIVVGGGIVGASCAEAAIAHGLRTCLVEREAIGVGATAAGMGHLVCMDDDPAEMALSRLSLGQWERFAEEPEAEFSRCGTLWVAHRAEDAVRIPTRVQRLCDGSGHARAVDARELYELEPSLAPGMLGGMLVADEAVVYPPRVARHLVGHAVRGGLHMYARCGVRDLLSSGVRLDDGTRLTGPVLLATGIDTPRLLPALPITPRRGHLLITERYPGLLRHQVLEMGYADSAHGHASSSVAFNVQPRPTGQILIGSSRESGVDDPSVSMGMVRRMLERAFAFMPRLRDLRALRAWTGLRPATPDGRPCLGAVPGHADLWVAAGHEGLGVTTALGSARLVLDLILGRTPPIDPLPYEPARFL